jgi:hypothetical protein
MSQARTSTTTRPTITINCGLVRLEADDDAMATCLACGADTFDLTDSGEVHSAGREIEWSVSDES